MALHASPPRPSKRQRTASPLDIAAESLAAEEELARQRFLSQSKLKSSWERIFAKYSQDFEGIADEIDQATGKIVVDNGHVRSMSDGLALEDAWEDAWVVEGGAKERLRLKDARHLAATSRWDDTPTLGNCKMCRYQDELDDSVCLACSLKPSSPSAASTVRLTLHSVSVQSTKSPTLISTIAKSPQQKHPRVSPAGNGDVPMGNIMDGVFNAAPASETGSMPSDAFTLEKLGSQGAAVVGLPAKSRSQGAETPPPAPCVGNTPRESKTTEDQIKVSISPQQSQSQPQPQPAAAKTPPADQNQSDQTDIRTWAPKKVITWLFTHGLLSDEDDMGIARMLKKQHVSGAVIVSSLTLDDLKDRLRIHSFSKRMQLWSGILKLQALASSTGPPPPTQPSVLESDPWAPPPRGVDPFYSHIWRDEHPDGTPAKFPPRAVHPVLSTPPAGGTTPLGSPPNGMKKRKKESLVESVSEPPNSIENVKAPVRSTPTASTKAKIPSRTPVVKGGSAKKPTTRTPATKSVPVKSPAATPTAKSVPAKFPPERTPATKGVSAKFPTTAPTVKRVSAKSISTRTPAAKSMLPKSPASTPAVKRVSAKSPPAKTPKTKTPAAKKLSVKNTLAKTPTKRTPAAKTPKTSTIPKTPAAKSPKAVTPGWTTGSISQAKKKTTWKSFLSLDLEDKDELSVGHEKDSPVPARTVKTVTPVKLTAQKEDNGETGGAAQEIVGERGMGHKCSGGFCFVCLNLEGEEDDLI